MSLREELEKRLLHDMIESCRGADKALVLNVDHHTSKILSSSARMYDVMETGVIVIENIFLARQKLALPAIYFVQPTSEIVNRLLHDFSEKYQQYSVAHVFFTETVPTELMQLINSSPHLIKHLKTLVELNADFVSLESYAFSCNRDPATVFSKIFSSNSTTMPANAHFELESISRQVASVCLTMHEYPYVRYAQNSSISKSIAQMFEREMNECMRKMSNWKYNETRERGTILFLDRSIDPTAPLMHEFTFQAMIYDLVRNRGEICYLPPNTKKTVLSPRDEKTNDNGKDEKENLGIVLGEDDQLWCEFRHKHISVVMTTLKKKFEDFTAKNALVKLQREQEEKKGAAAMKDMNKAVKDLAVYKETMRKYEKHMGLAEYCMGVFQSRNLKGLGDVEQDIATGIDDEGHKVDDKRAKEELLRICNDQHIRALEKIRLVLIYMINWGALSSSVQNELLQGVNPILLSCFREISKLQVSLNTNSTNKILISKDRQAEFQARNQASNLILMRFIPLLQGLMEHLVQFNLSEDHYPYLTQLNPTLTKPIIHYTLLHKHLFQNFNINVYFDLLR
jgi:syntaxin-binding protein 1